MSVSSGVKFEIRIIKSETHMNALRFGLISEEAGRLIHLPICKNICFDQPKV